MNKLSTIRISSLALSLLLLATYSFSKPKPKVNVGDNFIAFEAESTSSDFGQYWAKRPDKGKTKIAGDLPASGGFYIETISGNTSGGAIKPSIGVLQYKFIPKTSGAYKLTGRMAQNLALVKDAKKWDKANDVYIKMEGNFTATDLTPKQHLTSWHKYYGRGWANNLPKWGSFAKLDVHVKGKDTKFKAIYNLVAGEEYTLNVSTRSKGVIIDYFLLYKDLPEYKENTDIATLLDAKYRPKSKK